MIPDRPIFRWALWRPSADAVRMLSHSIGTFQHWFGAEPEYLVYTDEPDFLRASVEVAVNVRAMDEEPGKYLDDRATWRKWAPRFRHDPGRTEFRIDSDIFLVGEPTELYAFLQGTAADLIVTLEEFTALWPYGNFSDRLPANFSPINAGFLGQRRGTDLTQEVHYAYRWWTNLVGGVPVKYHDEQGAIAFVLQDLIASGRVELLDPARYRVVCPLNDPPVESLDGLVALHATYPEHPAYHKFLPEISKISGVPVP